MHTSEPLRAKPLGQDVKRDVGELGEKQVTFGARPCECEWRDSIQFQLRKKKGKYEHHVAWTS